MRVGLTAHAIAGGLAAVLLGGPACRAAPVDGRQAASAPIPVACTGVPVADARCYQLDVPEDRTRPGRQLALRIVVVPATGRDRLSDPVVLLAGGPGQPATDLLGDRSRIDGPLRQRRDLVYADQRGTGGSHALTCRFYGPPDEAQSYFQPFLPADKVRACRAALAPTADLAQYTTAASVADLEAIRAAFGYPLLNLVGGSYGTRLAMEYVRRHEDKVRTVVLESPVTPATHAPERFGQMAAAALDGVLAECLASPDCAEAFPHIRDEARTVFERLRVAPATAIVAHPSASRPMPVTLTRDHVAEAIRYLLYSSGGASRVPQYLHEAFIGNYVPMATFLIRYRAAGTFDGLYLSITCAEDVPFVATDAADVDEPTFLGGYRVRQQRAACAEWPRGAMPDDARSPVSAAVPVLITSGTLDPVTPPVNGDVLQRTLRNSLHVRVPRGGHTPAGLTNLECLSDLEHAFIERGRAEGLDTSCIASITRPGFVLWP